ncbi:hypothetical protein FQN60_000133 [Etheostoma spectabile]|uniref:Uncharacterized protein n=1 Tax=Etheostoma spectabile TaxID=54343 RepID=A0A5J5CC02_9PERO|nr:hypothetical protein FQN60_000133 [Etheostoma spectabile]
MYISAQSSRIIVNDSNKDFLQAQKTCLSFPSRHPPSQTSSWMKESTQSRSGKS